MRLPFLQVSMELIEQAAPDIAVELGADESKIGWGLVKLFVWALGRCPVDAPPSEHDLVEGPAAAKLIARAAQYKGNPEAFVEACIRARPALLEKQPSAIRIRGLDRYDAAWDAARSRSDKAKKAAKHRWSMSRASLEHEPSSARTVPHDAYTQTQIHTQTHIGESPPPPTSSAPAARVVVVKKKFVGVGGIPFQRDVDVVEWDHSIQGLWDFIQLARELLVAPELSREGEMPKGFLGWAMRVIADHGHEDLERVVLDFLRDESIRAPGHPTAVLISDGVWAARRPELKRSTNAGAAHGEEADQAG